MRPAKRRTRSVMFATEPPSRRCVSPLNAKLSCRRPADQPSNGLRSEFTRQPPNRNASARRSVAAFRYAGDVASQQRRHWATHRDGRWALARVGRRDRLAHDRTTPSRSRSTGARARSARSVQGAGSGPGETRHSLSQSTWGCNAMAASRPKEWRGPRPHNATWIVTFNRKYVPNSRWLLSNCALANRVHRPSASESASYTIFDWHDRSSNFTVTLFNAPGP